MLGSLLYRKSDFFVKNGVLLYKLLIHLMMDYDARSHNRRIQVFQSKCLRLVTGAPWYVSNRKIHEHLGVTLFADHVKDVNASFD
jgi:hypothetical protein